MHYYEKYNRLKNLFSQTEDSLFIKEFDILISNYQFESPAAHILPGNTKYFCDIHSKPFDVINGESLRTLGYEDSYKELFLHDQSISSNYNFTYSVIKPSDTGKFSNAIILFHGFNEKKWDKYLPWAVDLSKRLNTPIILFPLAFHMNRASPEWSDKKLMHKASKIRSLNKPSNTNSSYVNAAISTRLESNPQRLFWSGLQAYYDTVKFFKLIKSGTHPDFKKDTSINILSYSIGSFFSLIMMMADPEKLFSETKLFCFCGGATFDRMNSVSKYILDNQASVVLQAYYSEQLNSNFIDEERLSHYISSEHFEESYFKTMLNYHHFLPRREARLKEISPRISALALEKDDVVPPEEVLNTLQGKYRNIPTPVKIRDFPFPYTHITMFNPMPMYADLVDETYGKFLDDISGFLG